MAENKNILVTTFGASWSVLPELIGFVNPFDFNFFENHSESDQIAGLRKQHHIDSVNEMWVIHTDSSKSHEAIENFNEWLALSNIQKPSVKFFAYESVAEMSDFEECRLMSDLILRSVFHASEACNGGKLMLSLTGGRKNMSADIQRASDIFGCHCLIHIADHIRMDSMLAKLRPLNLLKPLDSTETNQLNPIVIYGVKNSHPILYVDEPLLTDSFALSVGVCKGDTRFIDEIDRRMSQSNSLVFNNYHQKISSSRQTSFYGLQLIHPKIINELSNTFIGNEPRKFKEDLDWLRLMPKPELHCHIGGILNASEMIEVSLVLSEHINHCIQTVSGFDHLLMQIRHAILKKDNEFLQVIIKDSRNILQKHAGVPEPVAVAAFLAEFNGCEDFLDELLYSELLNEEEFCGIGIDRYEKLGDLQGSGLLKSSLTLAKTCQILVRQCKEKNITYCELRCSPANYVTGDFTIRQVIETMHNELYNQTFTTFRLIIIGSRHNDLTLFRKHTNLVLEIINTTKLSGFFAGFDIAGNEEKNSPAELKDELTLLLQQCIKMTIHAGEGMDVANIWQAAYDLYADRIGHGLTLGNNLMLLEKFIDRRITVEMCPSSNHQIIGYKNFLSSNNRFDNAYPLKLYFDKGIRVTINTDNPGISRTDLPNEYLRAAQLTKGGLSRWDVLKIIRNGFRGAFIGGEQKKALILDVEKEIVQKIYN